MPEKKTYQSKLNWDKEHTKQIKAKLNYNTDADIIEHLKNIDNVAGYLKDLIRRDMEERK